MKVECDAYCKCYITSTIDSVHYDTTSMSHSPHSTPALSAFVRYISSDPPQHSRPHGALYAICVETTVHPAAPTLPRPPKSSTAACVRPPCPSSRVVPCHTCRRLGTGADKVSERVCGSVSSVPVKIASAAGTVRSAGTESCGASLDESVHQAGWTCARERSGGARAGKRTWGWLRVRRVGVIRGAACRHQPGAICNQGGGEFGAHQRSQVGQGDAPYRVGRVEYQKRFRTPWELTQEPSPGRANSQVHLPYPTAQCAEHAVIPHEPASL